MELIDQFDQEINELKSNVYGFIITSKKNRGVFTVNITIPENILNKEVSEEDIEFLLVIDTYSLKLAPKLYCLTNYCFPHFADGRDLYNELRSTNKNRRKGKISLVHLLDDILEFIKINVEKGGMIFCGDYYLGEKYDLRIFQNSCETLSNMKENLIINGKSTKLNRILIISDVYFLLFEQEKWYKNNLTLIFWSSINNLEKIQKVKDNKTVILQWTQKDKDSTYAMSLTVPNREAFVTILLEKMHYFGMKYETSKVEGNTNIDNNLHSRFASNMKLKDDGDDVSQSQDVKLLKSYEKETKEKKKDEENNIRNENNEDDKKEEENKEDNKNGENKEELIVNDDDKNEKGQEKKEEN